MKTMLRVALIVAVAMAVAFSSTAVYAVGADNSQPMKAKMGERFKKMTEELNLAPEQKATLDKSHEEFATKVKELREKMRAARVSLKEELDKATTDMARVASLVAELKDLAGQQIQHRVDSVIAMKKVLTPEQFTKMKSSMEKHKKEFKEKYGKGDWHGEGHGDKPGEPDGM